MGGAALGQAGRGPGAGPPGVRVRPVPVGELDAFRGAEWPRADEDNFGPAARELSWEGVLQGLAARDGSSRLVGCAVAKLRGGVGHLSELLVAGDARGRGVGGALLAAFEAYGWEAGCHKLTLRVPLGAATDPLGFYLRRGWRVEAVHPRDMHGRDFVTLARWPPGTDPAAAAAAARARLPSGG